MKTNDRAKDTMGTEQKGHQRQARKNKRGQHTPQQQAEHHDPLQGRQPEHREPQGRQPEHREPQPERREPQHQDPPYPTRQPEREPIDRRPGAPRERSDEDVIGRPVQLDDRLPSDIEEPEGPTRGGGPREPREAR